MKNISTLLRLIFAPLSVLLAFLTALVSVPPLHAELVYSLNADGDWQATRGSTWLAQSFSTGSSPMTLDSVSVWIRNADESNSFAVDSAMTLLLYAADINNQPTGSSLLTIFDNYNLVAYADAKPTAASLGQALAANSTYLLVMQGSNGGTIGWKYSDSTSPTSSISPTPNFDSLVSYNSGIAWLSAAPSAGFNAIITATAIDSSNLYWLGSNGTLWSAGNNWSSNSTGTPTADFTTDSDIIFSASGSSNSTNTQLNGDRTIGSLTINTVQAVGISGGNLTINGSTAAAITTTLGAGNLTITAPLIIRGNATTFQIENLNTTLGSITSSNGVVKTGNGTLTITGNSAYTGGTVVNGGTLAIGADNLLLNTGNLSVGGGSFDVGSFQQTFNNVTLSSGSINGTSGTIIAQSYSVESGLASAQLAGNASLTKSTNGTVTLSGTNTYTDGTTILAGTLNINSSAGIGSGPLTILGGTIGNTGNTSITLSNNNPQNWNGDFSFSGPSDLNLGTGNVTMDASRVITVSGGNLSVGGVVAGTDFSLTKNGAGTLTLNGNNTYSGGTFIESGTLAGNGLGLKGNITNNATLLLGSNTYTIEITGTGRLLVNGDSHNNAILRGNATMRDTTIQSGTLTIGGVNSSNQFIAGSISGNISNAGILRFDMTSGTRTYSDVISGNGSLGTSFAGNAYSGILYLTGNNTYTGGTNVSVGTVDISGGSLSSTGNVFISNDGTFAIGASDKTIGGFLINGTQTAAATGTGSLTATSYDLRQGTVSLSLNGTAGLTKNSMGGSGSSYANGVVYLSGNNTSTGNITINSGILSFNTVQSLYRGNNASWTPAKISVSANSTLALGTGRGGSTEGFNNDQIAEIFANLTANRTGGEPATTGFTDGSSIGINVASGSFTLNSTITDRPDSGKIGMDKIGSGVLTLAAQNTFSGKLNIFEGFVRAGNDNALSPYSSLVVTTAELSKTSGYDVGDFSQQFVDVTLISGTLAGGTGTINATGNYTMWSGNATANLSGVAPLLKTGSGTVFLSGNNTYIGQTTLNGTDWTIPTADTAKLQFQNASSLYSGNNDRWNTGNITVNNGGILSVRADESGAAGFTDDQIGTLITNLITANRPSGGLLDGSAFGIDTAGTNMTLTTRLTDSGVAVGGRIGLVKYGVGTLTLNSTNTHSLVTSITGGILALASEATLSGSNAPLFIENAALDMGSTSQSVASASVINGAILGDGTLTSTLNNATGFSFGNATIAANLAGAVSANIYSPTGITTTTLAGNNTYTGNTILSGNTTLSLENVNALSSSTLVHSSNGSSIQFSAGSGTYYLGGLSGSNNIDIDNNTLSIGANGMNTTYSGNITDTGAISKVGNGTLSLTGNSTYTGGTTISAGTLSLGNGGITGSVTGDITNHATLAFNRAGNVIFAATISGTGNVTKQGSGRLTLNGSQTYTGSTTVSRGTLELNGSLASHSVGITSGASLLNQNSGLSASTAVQNSGSLAFNAADTIGSLSGNGSTVLNAALTTGDLGTNDAVSGTISGNGSLTKNGTGTLIFSGSNTYSGGTTISGGTLQIGNGSTNGTITGNITNNAALAINRSNTVSFADNITGTGELNQIGTGTLILTSNNTYTGNTTVSNGTLQLGNGGTSGWVSGNIINNAILAINRSNTVSFADNITGTGELNQIGTGTLILTSNNTYTGNTTVSNGTLQLGNGGTSGWVSGNIINNAILAINRSDDIIFGNTLTGTGSVIKLGNNTLTYNSTTSPQGGTIVNAGTLLVSGTTSSVTVNNSGILVGNGTISDVTINSGGTIAPGTSPGTLTTGNMTWNGGGIYNWEITSANGATPGTDWDFINSNGSLTISANSTNQFTIAVSTNNSTNGFDPNVPLARWKIAEFDSGITGFASNSFNITTSGFGPLPSINIFYVSLEEENKVLNLNYANMATWNASIATWNAGNGTWSNAANWVGGVRPVDGMSVKYANPSGSGGVSTYDNTGNFSVADIYSLQFSSGTDHAYTIAGGNLAIGEGGIVNDSNSTQTIVLNLALGANQTFAANTANLIVRGNISGNASLTKAGNQTLTLSGSNSYNGATTIISGTLLIESTGQILHSEAGFYVGGAMRMPLLFSMGEAFQTSMAILALEMEAPAP